MSFVNFVHLRSFPQFYPHRWISRHIGLSLICMSLIFLRFSFPLPLPQLYNTAFYCVSKTLTANCEPTFMTARLPVCLPACLEQDITIYRILCNRDITYYVCTLKLTTDAQWSLLGLGGQIGQINFAELSTPILVLWVSRPLFNHYFQDDYFYKKLSLYIHIPNNNLRLGFEFGPQRIRNLAVRSPCTLK